MARHKSWHFLVTTVVALALMCMDASACLTFCLQRGKALVYGRNFDWPVDVGAVFVNPRNIQKTAFVLPPEKPMVWTSKYGSITFNQFSREFPVEGMNEHGLVIASLVCRARHAPKDDRRTMNELQWIQFHLDTCKTVAEVIESAKGIRISAYAATLHYFLTDKFGGSAVIEFTKGNMVHRSAATLPTKVLANTPYDFALKRARSGSGRFARAAKLIREYDGQKSASDYSFKTLDAVAQGDFTKWQVVYDIPRRRIYFRSLRKRKTKIIDASGFKFDKLKHPLMLDVNISQSGPVQKLLEPYTQTRNDKLIQASLKAFKKTGIMGHITPKHVARIRKCVAACKVVEAIK
jgi:choloylglycine hydrolase